MMDYFALTARRSLTFYERTRLTLALFSLGLGMPGVWLRIVWSVGATVSSSPIDQQSAKLNIETRDGSKWIMLMIHKRQVTT